MREIKFRAWDRENKEMLDVQELDYQDSYNRQPMVRTTMYNDYFDTEDMILMQYTGLKDITGKEIYEGDIVLIDKINKVKGKVEYSEQYTSYIVTNTNSIADEKENLSDYREIQVIGNIYENKELMKEKE